MSWATRHIASLLAGETVSFRPRGNSMTGKIESGDLCTVVPVKIDDLKVGDIVLCKMNGNQYLHLVTAIRSGTVQISNNKGRVNGWIGPNSVYGRCVKVER